MNNEAVLKALFKLSDDELDFTRAVAIAVETEDAAKVVKKTIYGNKPKLVNKVKQQVKPYTAPQKTDKNTGSCYRCGKSNHNANQCYFKGIICKYCNIKGHLKKARTKYPESVSRLELLKTAHTPGESVPKLEVSIDMVIKTYVMKVDTATTGNFIIKDYWEELGCPALNRPSSRYEYASKHEVPIMGTFLAKTSTVDRDKTVEVDFHVTDLNLLRRSVTKKPNISVDNLLNSKPCHAVFQHLQEDNKLKTACHELCKKFPDLWIPGLGCLKGVELEVNFQSRAKPVFCKARPVPLALQEDLEKAYRGGIAKGTWEPVQFDYGTPVVPEDSTPWTN